MDAELVRRHPFVERVARPGGLAGLDARVAHDQGVVRGKRHVVPDGKREEPDVGDLADLTELDRGVVGAAAARAHEPFALAAHVHEIRRRHVEAVGEDQRLGRCHDQGRRRTEPGRHGDVAADYAIHAMNLPVAEFLLEPEHGGFEIVAPIALEVADHLDDRFTVDEVVPVVQSDPPQHLAPRELEVAEDLRVGVPRTHGGVGPAAGDEDLLAVDGHQVDATAPVVDVPAHEIDAPRRANDGHRRVVAVGFEEQVDGLEQVLPLFLAQVGVVAVQGRQHALDFGVGGAEPARPVLRRFEHAGVGFAAEAHLDPGLSAKVFLDLEQFFRAVEPQHVVRVVHGHRDHGFAGAGQYLDGVGEVLLVLDVLPAEVVERLEQDLGLKHVHGLVDHGAARLDLGRGQRFVPNREGGAGLFGVAEVGLLDAAHHAALVILKNASRGGPAALRGDHQGQVRLGRLERGHQFLEDARFHHFVPRHHQHRPGKPQAAQDGRPLFGRVARPHQLRLIRKHGVGKRRADGLDHFPGQMAHHQHIGRRAQGRQVLEQVEDGRFARYRKTHLGRLGRLHPPALPGAQDYRSHLRISSHAPQYRP